MNETPNPKARWRTLRRSLLALAMLATLVAIFYSEENWRGRRAWEHCQQELAAAGNVMEWEDYIPPAVPDAQNFFKAPKMSEWFVKGFGSKPGDGPVKLTNEFTAWLENTNTLLTITNRRAAADYLAWSDQFAPQFDLIRTALQRPYARMDGDYSVPNEIPIPNFLASRLLAQVLSQRTKCHLLLNQPELALRDITLLNDSRQWLAGAPTGKPMTIVAAMINVAVAGVYVNTLAYGLEKRAWLEPQLLALQSQLADINLAPMLATSFMCEPVAVCRDIEILDPYLIFYVGFGKPTPTLRDRLFDLIPRGWIYQNMVTISRLEHQQRFAFDLTNQVFFPAQIQKNSQAIEQTVLHARFSPYAFLTVITFPNLVKATQSFALNQTRLNEAQIVCALERFQRAHGNYPDTLNALVPQFLEKIPHDLIGGQPLHYRRTADGKFLLYSLGWNETDDGGQTVLNQDGNLSREKGDWVWQYPLK